MESRQAGRQGGSGALRRCGREAAGMASVVLSEAEKLYIVHGVQVPGRAPGRERVGLGRREPSTVVCGGELTLEW